jgi:hypothetical protein
LDKALNEKMFAVNLLKMQIKDRAVEKLSLQSAIHYYLHFSSENVDPTTSQRLELVGRLHRLRRAMCGVIGACASEKVFLTTNSQSQSVRVEQSSWDLAL